MSMPLGQHEKKRNKWGILTFKLEDSLCDGWSWSPQLLICRSRWRNKCKTRCWDISLDKFKLDLQVKLDKDQGRTNFQGTLNVHTQISNNPTGNYLKNTAVPRAMKWKQGADQLSVISSTLSPEINLTSVLTWCQNFLIWKVFLHVIGFIEIWFIQAISARRKKKKQTATQVIFHKRNNCFYLLKLY